MTTETLLPNYIKSLAAYQSAKSEKRSGTTWLNANESPFNRACTMAFDGLNRYPDPQPAEVIARYAAYAGVNTEQLLMTRGADEAIELLIRTYCEPGKDSITIFAPTYGMYRVSADSHNVGINALTQSQLQNDSVASLCDAIGSSKLVFICNPNNPTGSVIEPQRIAAIAKGLRGRALVVVDEAYIEFCAQFSATSLIAEYDNLVVTRTLSKAFSLAGLRVGFLLGNGDTLASVRKVIAPYPVATPVAQIAVDALSPDSIASMRRQVAILNELKRKLTEWLTRSQKISDVIDGEGNFVLVRLTKPEDLDTAYQNGLVMRAFRLFDQDGWVRISIGSDSELLSVKSWLDGQITTEENI